MDSVAGGARFWQWVRLSVAGRAWASPLGVFGGDVSRMRMACGRYECGRRCARRVTQEVGVMQHSSFRGKLGRQELVAKVVLWGRESRGGRSVVCVGPVASRPTSYGFGVTLEAKAVVVGLGRTFGSVECEADGPACNKDLLRTPGAASAFDVPSYARLLLQESMAVVGKAWFQRCCAWFGEVGWRGGGFGGTGHPVPVVLERVLAGLAAIGRTGGRCRCVLAMGNSVAPLRTPSAQPYCIAVVRSAHETGRISNVLDVVAYCIWTAQEVRLTVQLK